MGVISQKNPNTLAKIINVSDRLGLHCSGDEDDYTKCMQPRFMMDTPQLSYHLLGLYNESIDMPFSLVGPSPIRYQLLDTAWKALVAVMVVEVEGYM
jgi:hypothetical protein